VVPPAAPVSMMGLATASCKFVGSALIRIADLALSHFVAQDGHAVMTLHFDSGFEFSRRTLDARSRERPERNEACSPPGRRSSSCKAPNASLRKNKSMSDCHGRAVPRWLGHYAKRWRENGGEGNVGLKWRVPRPSFV